MLTYCHVCNNITSALPENDVKWVICEKCFRDEIENEDD